MSDYAALVAELRATAPWEDDTAEDVMRRAADAIEALRSALAQRTHQRDETYLMGARMSDPIRERLDVVEDDHGWDWMDVDGMVKPGSVTRVINALRAVLDLCDSADRNPRSSGSLRPMYAPDIREAVALALGVEP